MQYLILLLSLSVVFAEEPECKAIAKVQGEKVSGNVTFVQGQGQVHVSGVIVGLPAGEYGFHVHEKGDITGGCLSAGAHYNPTHMQHGHPSDTARHVGDLGNVNFNTDGVSFIDIVDPILSLTGPHSIIGRTLVLHEKADDFGRSNHPDSKKTGNAGGRVACGVIGILSPVYSGASSLAVPSFFIIFISTIVMLKA